jgi:AcrR family transcriptional regulator
MQELTERTPAGGRSAATRTRILQAALQCVERWGLAKTSLEDVAASAGLSRATVYRYFPGGREQLISDTVTFEVANFLEGLGAAMADDAGLAAKLEHGLQHGHRAIEEHTLLHQILSTEPEALLKELARTGPSMMAAVREAIADDLRREHLRDGVDVGEAADYLTRMFLSYLGSQGRWDLDDRSQVERLVRTQFLAGVLVGAP